MEENKQLYLLIGGQGFLGSAFAGFLANKNLEVLIIRRGELSAPQKAAALLKEVTGHTRTKVSIVDFAYTTIPNSSFDDPVKDYTENLYNILHHIDFLRKLPNATYTYISSGGTVYGNPLRDEPISEGHRLAPLSPYGITKLACEHYSLMYKQVYDLDLRIVRPSNIYGPGQLPFRGQGIVATAIAKMITNQPVQLFGDGSTVRDYLFIDDFCRALYDVVNFGKAGEIYNAGQGEGCSISQLLTRIKFHLGGAAPAIDPAPFRPFDVRYNVLDASKINALNGWRPGISLDEGLKKTINWLKQGEYPQAAQ